MNASERYQRNRQKDREINDGGELLKYPEQERVEHEEEDEEENEPRLGPRRAEDPFAPGELLSFGCLHHSLSLRGAEVFRVCRAIRRSVEKSILTNRMQVKAII